MSLSSILTATTAATSTLVPSPPIPSPYPRFEVDVVFPRNETYNWAPVFPIILAIQNPQNATALGDFHIRWDIMSWREGRSPTGLYVEGDDKRRRGFFSNRVSFKDNEPFYLVNATNVTQWRPGRMRPAETDVLNMYWSVEWDQGPCSNPHYASGEIRFTINNETGITPNIMDAVDKCPDFASLIEAVNTTLTKNESCPGYIELGRELANPCGSRIDKAKASSIASEIQHWATYTEPVEEFPTFTPPPSAGLVAARQMSAVSVLMLVGLVSVVLNF